MSGKSNRGQLNIDDVFAMNYGHPDSLAKNLYYQIRKSLKGE